MRRVVSKYAVTAVFGAACLGLAVVIACDLARAATASVDKTAAPSANVKYYPPVLIEPIVSALTRPGEGYAFAASMKYGGGLGVQYPQIGSNDVIPAVRLSLNLPSGTRIVKSKIDLGGLPNNGSWFPKVPASSLRWGLVRGRPTWLFLNLHQGEVTRWRFTLSVPGTAACVKADAQVLYLARVKVGGRFVKKLVPIPHAPLQHGQTDGCSQPAGTTTAP